MSLLFVCLRPKLNFWKLQPIQIFQHVNIQTSWLMFIDLMLKQWATRESVIDIHHNQCMYPELCQFSLYSTLTYSSAIFGKFRPQLIKYSTELLVQVIFWFWYIIGYFLWTTETRLLQYNAGKGILLYVVLVKHMCCFFFFCTLAFFECSSETESVWEKNSQWVFWIAFCLHFFDLGFTVYFNLT